MNPYTPKMVMAATGLGETAALLRLARYRKGEVSEAWLLRPRSNTGRRPTEIDSAADRARLDAIPGGTEWERVNIPDKPDPGEAVRRENERLVAEIQRRTGAPAKTAWRRVHYWRANQDATRECLFRPYCPGRGNGAGHRPVAPPDEPKWKPRGVCPVTGGCVTRMSEESFRRACRLKRAPTIVSSRYEMPPHPTCVLCGGQRKNWPQELTIIELGAMTTHAGEPASLGIPVPDAGAPGRKVVDSLRPTKKTSARGGPPLPDEKPGNRGHISPTTTEEEQPMAKERPGVCDICGQRAQTRNAHGVNHACPTCVKIIGFVVNHGERVATAARMTGRNADLATALGATMTGPEGAAQLEAAVSTAMRSLANALPADPHDQDEGETHSLLDIEDLARRAAGELEADANAARAWRLLMDEVERHGLIKVTAANPENMIRQFMEASTAPTGELAELKEQAAKLLGCPQDEIIPALRLTEATLRTIRETVEPEIEGETYTSLPEACRLLVQRYHAVRDAEHDAAEDEAAAAELENRVIEAEREVERLRDRLRERLKTGNDPMEDALLQWAICKFQEGKVTVQVEVQEVEA